MSFIVYLLIGLIAGTVAKSLMGDRNGGWVSSLLLGIVGGLVGGFLGELIFGVHGGGLFNPFTWILSIGGSVLVIFLARLLAGKRR